MCVSSLTSLFLEASARFLPVTQRNTSHGCPCSERSRPYCPLDSGSRPDGRARMDTSLLTQRRRRGCWPDSKVPPIILPSWCSHPCGIPPALFQGDPCDHDVAGMPYITSRLGYKRHGGFLSLCGSLSPGSLALGEASCHVLRTLGQPRGEAVRPVPGGASQPPHR